MGTLETRTAGSRLAIVLTTAIVTTVVLAGGVAVATVGFNSVGSAQIKNGSVQSADIATGGVKTVDIANGTIGTADIRNNAVRGLDIRDSTITSADLAAAAQPAGVAFADGNQFLQLTTSAQSVRSVVLDAPASGHVIVTASGAVGFGSSDFDSASCSITDGPIAVDFDHAISADDFGVQASTGSIPLSGTRTFAVPAGPTTFRLVCQEGAGDIVILDSQVTALYVPALYAP